MKRAILAGLVVSVTASAQVPPIYPSGSVPDAPRTLDPGAAGNQAPPAPAPAPAQAPAQKPNIMVVGPDGKVTYGGDQNAAPGGYYVPGGNAAPTPEEPAEVHAGPTPELHVVRRGDTLWDICFYYFNDPWQWPRVWSYNPQITNPHWIYPGDLVRLLPRGVFAAQAQPGAQEPETAASQAKPADNVPAPRRELSVGIKQTAFVEKSDLDKSLAIDGSVDEKVLLGPGDQVYLSYPDGKPPQVGQTYSIYEPDHPVKHDGKDVGAYVHIMGALQVVSVKQDKRARAVVTEANQELERGLKVGPLIKQYKTVPPSTPKVDAQGNIIAMLKPAQLVGQGELVFVDLGQGSGVEVGNRMFVVRRGDAYPPQSSYTIGQDDKRFPARALGEVVIVEIGPKISVGLVTLSVQEMGVGDVVIMQKAK